MFHKINEKLIKISPLAYILINEPLNLQNKTFFRHFVEIEEKSRQKRPWFAFFNNG